MDLSVAATKTNWYIGRTTVTGCKNDAKIRHLSTIAQLFLAFLDHIFATETHIDNRKKNC